MCFKIPNIKKFWVESITNNLKEREDSMKMAFCLLLPRANFKTNNMTVLCEICNLEVFKYKCSACFSPYCSLGCWKQHKSENNCKVREKVQENNHTSNEINRRKYFTEDTVSEDKLSRLGDSKTLRNILSNRYLQSTLKAIYDSTVPENAIKEAMKDPDFVEFVDECLKIVEES